MKARCPQLRTIDINDIPVSIASDRFLRFLQNCKSLKRILIDWNCDDPLNNEVLESLVGRENLVELRSLRLIKYKAIKTVSQTLQTSPFKDIRCVNVRLESRAVTPLAAAIKSAVRLSLEILDNEVMVLPALAPLTDLAELLIVFRKDVELPSEDILALNSMDSIIALGTYCRQLRFCEIWGAQINFFELALIQAPLFPALEYVQLDATATAIAAERTELPSQAHQELDALVDSILKHAPLLKRLRFASENGQPQCVHVLNAFDARVRGIRREDGEVGDDWDDDWEVDMDISYLQSE